jgi:MoaA/NifB/PqqE/SkfB family radical SAM enzyme
MTTTQVLLLIKELSESGTQRINLLGGEPLIREDVGKIIKYAKARHMLVTMSSNGFFVPEKIEEIKKINQLLLTFDGPKKVYESFKGKGSYEKLIDAIKVCKENGINIGTMTILTNKNLKYVDDILRVAKKYNFLAYFQLLMHNTLTSGNTYMFLPSDKEYRKSITKILIKKKRGYPVGNSLKYLEYLLNWPDYKKSIFENWPFNIKKGKCWAGKLFCYIECDGYVYPCLPKAEKVIGENFLEKGFKRAFNAMGKLPLNCWCYFNLESNILFSLNPNAILNALTKL